MAAIYTTLNDTKRLLRATDSQKRVKFSSSIKSIDRGKNNTGTIFMTASGITIDTAYAGHEMFTFVFSDATNFSCVRTDPITRDTVTVGSGTVGADFTVADVLTVEDTAWTGTAIAADEVSFQTNSDISDDDGTAFIEDSQIFIDSMLEENGYMAFRAADDTALIWTAADDVPKQIKFAAARLSAYFIFSSIFHVNRKASTPSRINTEDMEKEVVTWLREAMYTVAQYIKKVQVSKVTTAPVWSAEAPLIQGKGVDGEGLGIFLPDRNKILNRASMHIDGLLDWNYLVGATITIRQLETDV